MLLGDFFRWTGARKPVDRCKLPSGRGACEELVVEPYLNFNGEPPPKRFVDMHPHLNDDHKAP